MPTKKKVAKKKTTKKVVKKLTRDELRHKAVLDRNKRYAKERK